MQVTFHAMHTNHGKCRHYAANMQTCAPFIDQSTQAEISVHSSSVYNPNADKQQLLQKTYCISAPGYYEHREGKLR